MKIGFCIVGAMKAGTTSLYLHMRQHPEILFPTIKEPGFFSRSERFERGVRWYESLFPAAAPHQLLGEASTCYSRSALYPDAAARLYAYSPNVKLIYIMRNPVDRALSHYVHEMQIRYMQGESSLDINEFLWTDPEVLCAGLYINEIQHLLKTFSSEQLLLLRFEDLTRNPKKLFGKIWKFLEVSPVWPENHKYEVTNPRGEYIASWESERHLDRLRKTPILGVAAQLVPARFRRRLRSRMKAILARTTFGRRKAERFLESLENPTRAVRLRLLKYYAASTDELEDFTGWDLSNWRN